MTLFSFPDFWSSEICFAKPKVSLCLGVGVVVDLSQCLSIFAAAGTMAHTCLLLLLLFLSLGGFPSGGATVLYVKPTEETQCPGEPCHTLDEYAQTNSSIFNDATMEFLPGTHTLSQIFMFIDVSNLIMTATNPTQNLTIILCGGIDRSFVWFNGGSGVVIAGLSFANCSSNQEEQGSLSFNDVSGIIMARIVVWHSAHRDQSCGICLKNVQNIVITETFIDMIDSGVSVYASSVNNISVSHTEVSFRNATFGFSCGAFIGGNCGNSVFVQVNFIIGDNRVGCAIYANCSDTWGGKDVAVTVRNSSFGHGQYDIGAIAVFPYLVNSPSIEFTFESLIFENFTGTALKIISNQYGPTANNAMVAIREVTFTNICGNTSLVDASIVKIRGIQEVTIVDCEFLNNTGTPIHALDNTILQFSGTITFHNNSAYQGGAISLFGDSHIYVSDGANVTFRNNTAKNMGGAVFVDQSNTFCFVVGHSSDECSECKCLSFNVSFIGNMAKNGGDAIYGADIDTCQVVNSCYGRDLVNGSLLYFNPNFDTDRSMIASDPVRVCLCDSATGKHNCGSWDNLTQELYPGQEFSIFAVDIGDMNVAVDGPVFAQFLQQNSESLEGCQYYQQVISNQCTKLRYSVFSNPGKVVMALTVNTDTVLRYDPRNIVVYINITLLPCPLGFLLSSASAPQCVCDNRLHTSGISCNITDQTIRRSGTIWVNASFVGNVSNGVIVHKHCPFSYCKLEEVNVNLKYPDAQCAFNHSGTLCGACQPGLSLALGTPQCLPCHSNRHLSLLLPFAAAGLVLVFFIKILNLTVAEGTINGLIFYANIIRASQSAYFPVKETNPLTVFIAWLNLDFGFESCFYNGLDGYWKTWLQFVFPIYIWAIVILIIVLSYYFTIVAKIFGNNSVPVLATLILLSYAKLLRTIITALSFTFLELPDGSRRAVWSFDGNIRFLSPEHTPLFIFAICVLLFLWLPYTVLLLSEQFIQKIGIYTVRKWMLNLKPFLDAYFGPFRSSHRYWVGVLLVARGVLLLIFGLNFTNDPNINLLAVSAVVLLLWLYIISIPQSNLQSEVQNRPIYDFRFWVGSCYKKWHLSILENSFLFNLLLLTSATIYAEAEGNQRVVVHTSVGVAFCQFIGITMFHAYRPIRTCWRKVKEKLQDDNVEESINRSDYELIGEQKCEDEKREKWLQGSLFESIEHYRESMLEFEDN